jgi:uncharacterized protein (TIGR03437 family)
MNTKNAILYFAIATVAIRTATAQIQVLAVTDSATFTPGLPYYGSLASVFCTGLTGIDGIQSAKQYPLPYEIAGVSVTVSGTGAPLLAVVDFGTYQQINIQVPGFQAPQIIEVAQFGQTGQMQWQFPAMWGVFFTDASGYAIVQHADYSLVTLDHPAQPGEVLIAYGTNLAPFVDVINAPKIGFPAQAAPLPSLPTSVSYPGFNAVLQIAVNGKVASLSYLGLTPGSVGVFQANFQVPTDIPDGDAILNFQGCGGSCFLGALCGAPGFLSNCTITKTAKVSIRAAGAPQ